MELAAHLRRGFSRQFSTESIKKPGKLLSFRRKSTFDTRNDALPGRSARAGGGGNVARFTVGRQSSLDPSRVSGPAADTLTVPENLDSTMQLLFMACQGDVDGVEELLDQGVDVNGIDLDGRTALHIASCEGHLEVVRLLLRRNANIDARDRWGSTAAADAKFYGNTEVYNILRARGAKNPKTRKTPMVVSNPKEVPEYEMNPSELQIRTGDASTVGTYRVAKWNGTKFAVKILDKDSYLDQDSINAFQHELTLLERARHPNVVQFVGAVTQNVPMMIVLEYHPRGDLGSYLHKKGRLQAYKVLKFALDIARGMNYLHECKPEPIIHCDLKPKNILLDSGGHLKVAGFGLIKMSKKSPKKVKLANLAEIDRSSLYMAPEVYKDEVFDRSVDVFSFGFIVYEMIEGVPAFHPKAPEDVAKMICLEGSRPQFKAKSKSYPLELKELIEECWDAEPVVRPTFSEIIVRLDKIYSSHTKQSKWKDKFKLPW